MIAPTLPGSYGGPPLVVRQRSLLQAHADYVERLLDASGLTAPVAIVGSSHGAVTALELAARGRASQVIALAPPWTSTPVLFGYGALVFGGTLPLRIARGLEGLAWSRTPASARARVGGLMLQFSPTPLAISDDDLLATIRSVRDFPFLRLGPGAFRKPVLPDLDQIRCPVVIVYGTAERTVPRSMTERWMQALPHAELIELAGLRHVPHLTDPDRIAALLLEQTQTLSTI